MIIKEKFVFQHQIEKLFIKDASLDQFEQKFDFLSSISRKLYSFLPNNYKFYLVDFIVQKCSPGLQTCRDIRWHFDGDYERDNIYALWVNGPNRTQFANKISTDLRNREDQNQYLEKVLSDIEPTTVPDSTIVVYDSQTPHRGVLCSEHGKRTFVRLVATNYLKPRRINVSV